ncbi:MAG: hypothetical protein ACRC69_08555 [Acinetobacter baumannii]
MKNMEITRMIVGSQLIIAFYTIGYSILMMLTSFFKNDKLSILHLFDGKIDAILLFTIGFLLIIFILANKKKLIMLILILLCGIFLGYSGAYLAHATNGFVNVGLISFICMFFLDFLTLLEVNPDE